MRPRTLQSTLDQRAGALIGRERERDALLELVECDAPLITVVHGIAGVGKSMLLHAAAVDARARGTLVVALDGRAFEPTQRGFLASLGSALGTPVPTVAAATEALAGDARTLLTIDTHERLRLLDAWLRQSFVPALPQNARLLLAGRDPPSVWQRDFGDLLRTIRLDNLSDEAAWTLLRRAGVADAIARRVARVTRGHPLSLQLAAAALAERPWLSAEDAVLGPMVEELARLYIDGLDPQTRRSTPRRSSAARRSLCSRRCCRATTQPSCSPRCVRSRLSSLVPTGWSFTTRCGWPRARCCGHPTRRDTARTGAPRGRVCARNCGLPVGPTSGATRPTCSTSSRTRLSATRSFRAVPTS
jgi:hypothetical protein